MRPERALCIGLIRLYQYGISPVLPRTCRYLPTCSDYAREAIERHGAMLGGWLALRTLGGEDPLQAALDQIGLTDQPDNPALVVDHRGSRNLVLTQHASRIAKRGPRLEAHGLPGHDARRSWYFPGGFHRHAPLAGGPGLIRSRRTRFSC